MKGSGKLSITVELQAGQARHCAPPDGALRCQSRGFLRGRDDSLQSCNCVYTEDRQCDDPTEQGHCPIMAQVRSHSVLLTSRVSLGAAEQHAIKADSVPVEPFCSVYEQKRWTSDNAEAQKMTTEPPSADRLQSWHSFAFSSEKRTKLPTDKTVRRIPERKHWSLRQGCCFFFPYCL